MGLRNLAALFAGSPTPPPGPGVIVTCSGTFEVGTVASSCEDWVALRSLSRVGGYTPYFVFGMYVYLFYLLASPSRT